MPAVHHRADKCIVLRRDLIADARLQGVDDPVARGFPGDFAAEQRNIVEGIGIDRRIEPQTQRRRLDDEPALAGHHGKRRWVYAVDRNQRAAVLVQLLVTGAG